MIITPTLHFGGKCEEAIALYQKAFNCKVDFILHYSDANSQDWNIELSEEQKNYVYHSEIHIGEQRIMMADEFTMENKACTSLFLTVAFDTADEVEQAFNILKDGGIVIYPLHKTTYSSCMGSLIDKFGFRWGLMTEQNT